ncbi:MAG TPA: hypothetical protein PK096_01855 [Candidatus Saccharibacteria bacterium]|nr:hypothetical protein [Candidatus Saccharibacteria bacterium]HRK94091.1 hypothetical protein [Candidatus Saccharibacteria bacterium]
MAISVKQRVKVAGWAALAVAVASSPLTVSAIADTENTVINATVDAVISVTTGTPIAISLTPTAGGVVSSASDTVTVNTNNSAGYELTLKDTDTSSNLVSGGNNITPTSGTMAASTTLSNGNWGFAIATGTTGAETNNFDASYSTETNNASSTSKWAGMPTSSGTAYKLKDTSTTATNDTTTVWYAARVNTSQASGTYTDTVTYTATTN